MNFEKTKNCAFSCWLDLILYVQQPNLDRTTLLLLQQIIGKQLDLVEILKIDKRKIRLPYIQK